MSFEKSNEDLYLMQQTYATLFSLTNKLQVTGDKYLTGITSRQFMAIIALLHLPEEEATISNISRKLGTSKQNTNRMISNIEKLGFVKIIPSTHDKRATNVLLTDSGNEILKECAGQSAVFMADVFNNFNTDELKTLWTLLQKLYEFDGNKLDGYEEAVTSVSLDEKQTREALNKFSQKRSEFNK